MLFISWFLHQTTTQSVRMISKGTLFISWFLHQTTTSNTFSISKRMLFISWFLHQTTTRHRQECSHLMLFISWFLHQTTTIDGCYQVIAWLFISWFLHQTTTLQPISPNRASCLSLDSYIKPQPIAFKIQLPPVVYLLIPTSNHNYIMFYKVYNKLFISWFLHQTTTILCFIKYIISCLSLDSYIKPQLYYVL